MAGGAGVEMARHLFEKTLPEEDMRRAAYYGREHNVEEVIAADLGCIATVRSDMRPEVADALGINPGQVLGEYEVANLLGGRKADGSELPGEQREVREYDGGETGRVRHRISYTDFTLSAPKSLSVAWAFAETEAERGTLRQVHVEAAAEAMAYLESEVVGRGTAGREGPNDRGHMGWVKFDHFTSRPTLAVKATNPLTGVEDTEIHALPVSGDMNIHTHFLAPNVVWKESGAVVSMNRDQLKGRIHEFGAVYQALVATKLRAAGFDAELDERTLMARMPAIPQDVADEFSKRTKDGTAAAQAFAKAQGVDWDTLSDERRVGLIKAATQAHKLAKDVGMTNAQLKMWENSARKDDMASFHGWRQQAAAMNWQHKSAMAYGPTLDPAWTTERRMAHAHETARPLFADALVKRAVVLGSDARLAAARGLIASGIEKATDMGLLIRAMVRPGGVTQDGTDTTLIVRKQEDGRTKLTTELHVALEREFIGLARTAAKDIGAAVPLASLRTAIAASGLKFKGDHGRAQLAAIENIGTGGRLSVLVGVAGSGKTTLLKPLVAAWKAEGREVWGVAQAWKQATALQEPGIDKYHTRALDPLLKAMNVVEHQGGLRLEPTAIVVLDEVGKIGTREFLELQRFQARDGFKIVALGDDKQAQAIEAGPVVTLLREALGENSISEILSSVRQRRDEDREIAGMFREQRAAEALSIKAAAGTATLVPGGYADAIKRTAGLWAERVDALAGSATPEVTISAPTNADALAISRAIREVRQGRGEVGRDADVLAARDGAGNQYEMRLAEGDRVRAFQRVRAKFTDEQGRVKEAVIGSNGTVLDVVGVKPGKGLLLRGDSGKVGYVPYDSFRSEPGMRARLAYGDALTIDSAQGITTKGEHINALPNGSAGVGAFKGYVAESRATGTTHTLVSYGAELRAWQDKQPVGAGMVPSERQLWAQVAENLSQQSIKESALALLGKLQAHASTAARGLQAGLQRVEAGAAAGVTPAARQRVAVRRAAQAALEITPALAVAVATRTANVERVAAAVEKAAKPPTPEERMEARLTYTANLYAKHVVGGAWTTDKAIGLVYSLEMDAQRTSAKFDPVHSIHIGNADPGVVQQRAEQHVENAIKRIYDRAYEAPRSGTKTVAPAPLTTQDAMADAARRPRRGMGA